MRVIHGTVKTDTWYSVNILKIYQVIARHLENFPQDKVRFPNFLQAKKTILALGEDLPLEGELHSAEYFHGRYQ